MIASFQADCLHQSILEELRRGEIPIAECCDVTLKVALCSSGPLPSAILAIEGRSGLHAEQQISDRSITREILRRWLDIEESLEREYAAAGGTTENEPFPSMHRSGVKSWCPQCETESPGLHCANGCDGNGD